MATEAEIQAVVDAMAARAAAEKAAKSAALKEKVKAWGKYVSTHGVAMAVAGAAGYLVHVVF